MSRRGYCALLLVALFGLPAAAEESGYLGIVLGQLPAAGAASKGALVQEIFQDSPADRDGLKCGDLIIAVNDQEVADSQGLIDVTKFLKKGDKARFKVQRSSEKEKQEITVTLTQRPDKPLAELPLKKRVSLGIAFAIQPDGGLSVAQFPPDSEAEQAGMQVGDIITSINGHETKDYAAVLSSLAAKIDGETVKCQVTRNGVTQDLTIKLKYVAPQFQPK